MHDSPGLNYKIKICRQEQADFLEIENRNFRPKFSAEFEILDLGVDEKEQGKLDQSVRFKLKVEIWSKLWILLEMANSANFWAILSRWLLRPWANLRKLSHFRTFGNFWAILISGLCLGYFGPILEHVSHIRIFWPFLGYFGQFWAILNSFENIWAILVYF